MGRQIIKQPDGLYAVYSSIVDAFVLSDVTADQVVEVSRQEAADEAEERCRAAIARVDAGIPRGFSLSWEQALANHNRNAPNSPVKCQSS